MAQYFTFDLAKMITRKISEIQKYPFPVLLFPRGMKFSIKRKERKKKKCNFDNFVAFNVNSA